MEPRKDYEENSRLKAGSLLEGELKQKRERDEEQQVTKRIRLSVENIREKKENENQ